MTLTFGSLFAGIGGFDEGMHRSGMQCAFQVEREESCLRVLAKHWPDAKRFTDVRDFNAASIAIRPDLICGGFPCQDISVAGKRAGLAGQRSGLWWQFHRIIAQFCPRWVLIENVPGLLSSNEGRDLRAIVDALGQLGYGWAMRILDAQWFGVPQRRRRVFIVGCFGDSRRAAQILFEPESLPWDSPPSREARSRVAASLTAGTSASRGVNPPGRRREDDVNLVPLGIGGSDLSYAVNGEASRFGSGRQGQDTFVAHTLRAEGFDASEDGTGRGTPIVPVAFQSKASVSQSMNPSEVAPALDCAKAGGTAVAYQCHGSNVGPMGTLRSGNGNESGGVPFVFEPRIGRNDRGQPSEIVNTLKGSEAGDTSDMRPVIAGGSMGVRRLMPVECLRLQGFPDDWLDGLELSDSAKYKMCGNAVCVNVAEWIGRRIVACSK